MIFYIFKTNNYGGWTERARWFFWLTPMFLLALLPAADSLGRLEMGTRFRIHLPWSLRVLPRLIK